jgi:hypothetical protein
MIAFLDQLAAAVHARLAGGLADVASHWDGGDALVVHRLGRGRRPLRRQPRRPAGSARTLGPPLATTRAPRSRAPGEARRRAHAAARGARVSEEMTMLSRRLCVGQLAALTQPCGSCSPRIRDAHCRDHLARRADGFLAAVPRRRAAPAPVRSRRVAGDDSVRCTLARESARALQCGRASLCITQWPCRTASARTSTRRWCRVNGGTAAKPRDGWLNRARAALGAGTHDTAIVAENVRRGAARSGVGHELVAVACRMP